MKEGKLGMNFRVIAGQVLPRLANILIYAKKDFRYCKLIERRKGK